MAPDKITEFLIRRIGRSEDRPVDRMMEILRKVESKPTKLENRPPDPTRTNAPDGKAPMPPRPKRGRGPSPGM